MIFISLYKTITQSIITICVFFSFMLKDFLKNNSPINTYYTSQNFLKTVGISIFQLKTSQIRLDKFAVSY